MRVTGGMFGGRILEVPRRGVRPTADRVRESLFATLGDLDTARVLDLYAGSGVLGIEALSRGADRAAFVDRSPQSLSVLRRNLESLGLADRTRVVRGDAVRALRRFAREPAEFDLVFADPPYASDALPRLLPALRDAGILVSGARIVVERDRRLALPDIPGLELEDERTYGDTVIMRFGLTPSSTHPFVPTEA